MMSAYMLKSKKSQFWYADFLIAVLILVLISYLFISSINQLNKKQDKFQSISSDSLLISSTLMSEGYCADDDCENWRYLLGNIGFVENGKVIQDKLKALILLTSTNDGYETSKILLGTKNNYIFYFEDSDDLNSKITISGEDNKKIYGKSGIDEVSQINTESYVRTTRFVYLENPPLINTKKIVKLVVIVW